MTAARRAATPRAEPAADRALATVPAVTFLDGTVADVDLVVSGVAGPPERTFAASTFVRDAEGRFAVVLSVSRQQWGPPGGWREDGETVAECAAREIAEEVGLALDPAALLPCAHERFRPEGGPTALWRPGQDLMQIFRVDLPVSAPALAPTLDDTTGQEWLDWADFAARCSGEFWWPLGPALFG